MFYVSLFNVAQLEGSRAREHQVLARMRSISELRQAEEKASNRSDEAERAKWARQKQDDDNDEEERRMRSEMLRRQRSSEAQALIKQRNIDARAVFEQNTSAGQLSVSRRSSSSNVSSPSPTPVNNNGKVGAKWPPSSPNPVSPTPVSPTPVSPTPPVIHQQSVPTQFYSGNNHRSLPSESVSSSLEANNKRNAAESTNSAAIVPPAPPADFADAPSQIQSSPVLVEQHQPSSTPISPALAMLHEEANHQYQNQVEENGTDEQEWDTPAVNGSNGSALEHDEQHAGNLIENEAHEYGIRARALYDYQAGNDCTLLQKETND